MTDKEKTIKELKEALDGLDITNKYRLNIIRAIEYLQEEPVSEELEEAAFDYAEACKYDGGEKLLCVEHFRAGAQWYREQIMKGAKLSGWIARDEDGTLNVFEVEPRRIEEKGFWWDRDYQSTMFDKCEFPDLKWEDEPQEVKMIVVKED